jgi:hypothetical protein
MWSSNAQAVRPSGSRITVIYRHDCPVTKALLVAAAHVLFVTISREAKMPMQLPLYPAIWMPDQRNTQLEAALASVQASKRFATAFKSRQKAEEGRRLYSNR